MARTRERGRLRLLGVTGRRRSDLLISTALQTTTLLVLSCPSWAQPAPTAMPTGGSVRAGSATITQTASPTASTTTINQVSQRAAITWSGFDVGSQSQVNFVQPSASAIVLNRVKGPDPSQIAGTITANGQVILENQAGVTFYKGAQVNVQSLIVTSAEVSKANFMAGRLVFNKAGNPNASVVNQGSITVKQAGLAALVAPSVANSGVINAQLGRVVLAGAKTATLDLYGDGLLSLDVTNQVTQAPVGPGGTPVTALVTNTGVIKANGGTVQLTAAAADGVLQTLVQAGGKISANTVGAQTGTVTVSGIGGSVTVTGLLSASGKAAGTQGGEVAVNATGDVTLASTARVNASGAAGGGTVAIGTTLQRAVGGPGTVATMTAANATVQNGARITARATKVGNGGRVTVLSSGTTTMTGSINAMGGSASGNGGFVEVSGQTLNLSPLVDVSAPHGTMGTILLDPTNLDIIGGTTENSSSVDGEFVTSGGTSTLASGAADGTPLPSTVLASTLNILGLNGNVVVQASGIIDVQAPVTVANGLTMQAGGNLIVETGASIQAGGNILLQAGTFGALGINASIVSTAVAGTVQMIAGTGGITLNGNISAATVDLNATGGGVTQATNVGISATTLQSSNGVTGDVSLLGANSINALGTFAVTSEEAVSSFQLNDTVPLSVTGPVSATGGSVVVQSSGTIDVQAPVSANNGLTMQAGGDLTIEIGAPLQADNVLLQAGPAGALIIRDSVTAPVFQTGEALFVRNEFAFNVTTGAQLNSGTVQLIAGTGGITLNGNISAFVVDLDTTGGGVTQAGSVGINTDTLLSSSGVVGNVSLLGTTNAIGDLEGFTVTAAGSGQANFQLYDTEALEVDGPVSTPQGNIYLQDTAAESADVLIDGPVTSGPTAAPSGMVSIRADTFDFGCPDACGTISAGTFEAAPNTVGLGYTVFNLSGEVFAQNMRIGAVTPPGGGAPVVTAGSILITGTANTTFSVAGSLELDAASFGTLATGAVTQNTPIAAGTLGGTGVSITLNEAGNAITSLGNVTASNGFALTDSVDLIVTGVVNGGSSATINVTGGDLAINGTVSATAVGLTANDINIAGLVTDGGAGAVNLVANTGSIAETGTLIAGILSGTAVGVADFLGAGASVNQVATLSVPGTVGISGTGGSFTASSFALRDGAGLTVAGTVTANGTETQTGTAPGQVFLASTAPAGITITATGNVTATGGTASLQTDFLANSAATGVIANTIELAPATAGGTVTLGASGTGLSLLSMAGFSTNNLVVGAVTQPNGTAPATSAGAIAIAGAFTFNGSGTLTLDASSSTASGASGAVTQSAALTGVPVLSGTADSFTLTNTGNDITSVAGLTATNGNVTVVDDANLTLSGAISGNNLFFEVSASGGILTLGTNTIVDAVDPAIPVTLTAASGGLISLVADNIGVAVSSSTITVPSGTMELAPFSAINTSLLGTASTSELVIGQALLSMITPGISTLVVGGFTNVPAGATTSTPSASSVTVDAMLTLAPIATSLDLEAAGSVTQSAPIVNVGTLLGVSGSTTLANAGNTIGVLGNYIARNGFVLTDATSLTTAGELQAGPSATFNISGNLTEPGGITATQLSGFAVGTANLQGTNNIAQLDNFVVNGNAGSFRLQDQSVLFINGTLNATGIAVTAPQITLGDGTTIVTGGNVRPSVLVPPGSLFPQNGAAGAAFLTTTFTQIGNATVTGQGGGPSTLQISATGNVQFDPRLGLYAPGTWLILNVPNGRITGDVHVEALDVIYQRPGSADLFGSVAGNGGATAARLGFIEPEPSRAYLMNGCEIGAITCVGIFIDAPGLQAETTVFVPVDALLALVVPGLELEPEDKDDMLQLPVVSREDY